MGKIIEQNLVVFLPCGCVAYFIPDSFFTLPVFHWPFFPSRFIFPLCHLFAYRERSCWGGGAKCALLCQDRSCRSLCGGSPPGWAGGWLPAGKWQGKPGMCVWFATHEHFAANSTQHLCAEMLSCRDADRPLLFLGIALWWCLAVFLCMMKVSFAWMLSLAWSSWIGPIWNSKWTSEDIPSASCSHCLGLSKQQGLAALSAQKAFQSCSRAVFAHSPDSQTCPLNFLSTSGTVLLLLPGVTTQLSTNSVPDSSSFFNAVSLAALVETVACFTQILVFFLPRRNHTIPSAGLANYCSDLTVWGSVRLLLLLKFLTLFWCVGEESRLLRL